MNIEAVRNNVIFKFLEDINSGRFINSNRGKVLISSVDVKQSSVPRWGKVTHVGPDVKEIAVSDYILIEEGKWTPGFYVDGGRFWKTDDQVVLAVSDQPYTTY